MIKRKATLRRELASRSSQDSRASVARPAPAPPRWLLALFSGNPRIRALVVVLMLLILALAAWATYRSVERMADSARAATLEALLDSKVSALRTRPTGAPSEASAWAAAIFSPPAASGNPDAPRLSVDGFAFDQRGVALTAGRYGATLRALGLAPTDNPGTGPAGWPVLDPGRDLRELTAPVTAHGWPPTRLMQQALAARLTDDPTHQRGVIVDNYRNHVGAEVNGAWQWLPERGFGVAIEVAPNDIVAPLRYFVIAMQIEFALLILAIAVAVASTVSLASLGRRRRLGPYRLGEVIEEGGMAIVHHAEHELLKRPTAVKILKRHLASDELIARFEREVMLTSRLQNPATVEIYDYGRTPDGTFYFAMEYIDGLTLARLVESHGPQPVARVAHILKQVCESLREAHAKGLMHRDVKPPNIMLCERGGEADVVKVLDWGLIKDVRALESRDITQYVRVLGTPAYMPPERVRDPARADPQVDIYGIGAVAYFLLTGRTLFEAPNQFDLQKMVVESAAPRTSEHAASSLPVSLDELIARCLAKDPADRPRSVGELIAVFNELLRADPWSTERASAWWRQYHERAGATTAPGSAPASSGTAPKSAVGG